MLRKCIFAILLILALAACSPSVSPTPTVENTQPPLIEPTLTQEPTPSEITSVDGLGRTVTLASPALRVVSLTPSGTEILFSVGAGGQVVGRDLFSDYPAEAASVTDVGGSWGEYNLESIVALTPDLVLAGGINPPELVASIEELGLTVYFLPNPATLEDLYASLKLVSRLTGHQTEAENLVQSLVDRVATVDAAVKTVSEEPLVYYELDGTNPAAPYTAGPGTFVDLLIDRAGARNVGAELEGQWATISLEQLLVADPAVILLGDAAWGETPEKVAARPGWEALSAVKNGQVFGFDDNLVSRPGPRLVDGLEALVNLLHPGIRK